MHPPERLRAAGLDVVEHASEGPMAPAELRHVARAAWQSSVEQLSPRVGRKEKHRVVIASIYGGRCRLLRLFARASSLRLRRVSSPSRRVKDERPLQVTKASVLACPRIAASTKFVCAQAGRRISVPASCNADCPARRDAKSGAGCDDGWCVSCECERRVNVVARRRSGCAVRGDRVGQVGARNDVPSAD
jgi:hypothetical protein